MENYWDIIIVGAGIAGFSAAKVISEKAPATRLLLINGEDRIPYKRTKLSKFIATGFETNQFQLQPESWYRDQHIQVQSNKHVLSIEPQDHILNLNTGEHLHWKKDEFHVSLLAKHRGAEYRQESCPSDTRYC